MSAWVHAPLVLAAPLAVHLRSSASGTDASIFDLPYIWVACTPMMAARAVHAPSGMIPHHLGGAIAGWSPIVWLGAVGRLQDRAAPLCWSVSYVPHEQLLQYSKEGMG